ncbi:MAG: LysE family translocator [Paracoccaceae bacterium]|nr:LysE family translocator [Paracoccaceae bacterium]
MTISLWQLLLYMGGLVILFLTPGPVWVAITARALAGGFAAAWPLAVGVALGDLIWPLAAIFGLTWVLSVYGDFLGALRWVAAATFIGMGWLLIRKAGKPVSGDGRLTRPGLWAGFLTGVAAVLGNPKAILFYMGVLPGFFDLTRITGADIAAIVAASMLVPMLGNLVLAQSIDRARRLLSSPGALRRVNLVAGGLLIAVGLMIGLASQA